MRRLLGVLRRDRAAITIVAAFVVVITGVVGYNAWATDQQRPTALVVDVTARQRTLVERYIKDTVLRLDGVQADPQPSATILRETADALLDGGKVVTPQGSLDQWVEIPRSTGSAIRAKLLHERTLIRELLVRGDALLRAGRSSPTFDRDLRQLRIVGAELSSVTGDAAGELTKAGQARLSRLVRVEIVFGVLGAVAALGMGLLLRRSAQRQSARFRSLVHNATDLITVLDDHAIALYQSPSSERVLGYGAEDVVGTKLTDLLHPSDKREVIQRFAEAAANPGTSISVRFRLRHKDGRWLSMEGTATNLRKDRTVRGFVVNTRDVTDRERAAAELAAARDEALSASRTKSQFLASMSHEIRTPMNAIIGLTGLLLGTSLDDEQREYARGVEGAAEGLLGIINDILDFSKVEAGKLELEVVDLDLALLVEDVTSLLGDLAHAKGVELLAHYASGAPTALRGDPTRLRQVLLNLVSNAVKFTNEGEVVVRVSCLEDTGEHARMRVEVCDTGVGIAPWDLDRLFEPFSQADSSTTRRFGGTGLGLAIVKQLVELMGGTIGVASEVDVGSTFWFEVPLVVQAGGARPERPVSTLANLRTLVVDDNATNRLILREQLGSWGMVAEEAEHAVRALELIRAAAAGDHPYDVVVLDLNMPDVDGLELAHAITEDARIAGPRLFLLSSSGRVPRDVAVAAGLSGTLTKPVRQSELFNVLAGGLMETDDRPDGVAVAPVPSAPRRGRLLLVEDNAMNQLVATRILAKLGYEVAVAGNGREALSVLEHETYDAILMDCQMPEMDGYEATREIRTRESGTTRTPIIAMTAAAMQGDREACLAAGMDDYVTKPVRPETLSAALGRWLPADGSGDAEGEPDEVGGVGGVLDPERLEMLRELDEDGTLVNALVTGFLTDADVQLARLGEALAEGDPEAVERVAHTLKGSSANLGARRVSERAGAIEALARGRALGDAGGMLTELGNELRRVRTALHATFAVGERR